MLRHLSADDARFKSISFQDGLNLLLADKTVHSRGTDSRNGSGKSSVIELIHFMLGTRATKDSFFVAKALRNIAFELRMDWPGLNTPLSIVRSGKQPTIVKISPDDVVAQQGTPSNDAGTVEISIEEWNKLIERRLFALTGNHPGVSGRTLLSFLARRVSSHAFNEAGRTFSQQTAAEATTNLAYLLGLDWQLANRYRELAAQEVTRKQLSKAVKDPIFGKIVGSTADLRGQITLAEVQVEQIRAQVAAFQVVPEFERLKGQTDALSGKIKQLAQADVIDQNNLDELRQAVAETAEVSVDYLEPVYGELGLVLTDQVRRRYNEVEAFHHSVVRNRQHFLNEEIRELTQRLDERRAERARLGEEQAHLLRTLSEGGALEALLALQQALVREEAALQALRHRYEAAQTLEANSRKIKTDRIELQQAVEFDLDERSQQRREATELFSRFAEKLYGTRNAFLAIEAGRTSLSIEPRIDSDNSRGIGNMVIFCFDLTIAVLAHRHGRGPDFLIHDSHLYDGVDDRQIKAALELAAEVTRDEGMQYITTLNTDDLAKTTRLGFNAETYTLETRLTDSHDTGGLFGFRF